VAVLKTQSAVEFCNQQRDCGLRNRRGNTEEKGTENHKIHYSNRQRNKRTRSSIRKNKWKYKRNKALQKKRDTLINKKERKRGKKRKEKNEIKT